MDNIQLLTVYDLAKILKVGKQNIYKKIKDNEFPKPIVLGIKKYRWLSKDIENWLINYNK